MEYNDCIPQDTYELAQNTKYKYKNLLETNSNFLVWKNVDFI